MTTRALPFLLTLLIALPAAAQETKGSVRLVGAKATGKLKAKEKPAIDPKLKRFEPVLKKLKYDRYAPTKGTQVKTGAPKTSLVFDKLPLQHVATVTYEPAKKGKKRLLVSVTITRPAVPPLKGRVKVAAMKVRVNDGGHFLIKCAKAYPDGDLLLLVTASSGTLTK